MHPGTERRSAWLDRLLAARRPVIMGVLNLTPDSFSDGGQFVDPERAIAHAQQMIADGADIVDVGAESTRPYGGAVRVSADEERRRLAPVLAAVAADLDYHGRKAARMVEAAALGAMRVVDFDVRLRRDQWLAASVVEAALSHQFVLGTLVRRRGTSGFPMIMPAVCAPMVASTEPQHFEGLCIVRVVGHEAVTHRAALRLAYIGRRHVSGPNCTAQPPTGARGLGVALGPQRYSDAIDLAIGLGLVAGDDLLHRLGRGLLLRRAAAADTDFAIVSVAVLGEPVLAKGTQRLADLAGTAGLGRRRELRLQSLALFALALRVGNQA